MKNRKWLFESKKIARKIRNRFKDFASLYAIYTTRRRVVNRHKDIDRPIKVLFIAQYIQGWNKLAPLYNKMLTDKLFEPVIICVPTGIKNSELINADSLENDTYDYFISKGYNAINALIGRNQWLDLKELEPDYIFHSRPYNQFMPKEYSSKKIRKYALMCNVLYAANTTKNCQEVTINRNYFSDVFCFFAFDKLEVNYYNEKFRVGCKLGIQHCYPYGAIALEEIMSFKNYEKLSKTTKRVMWTPRWSTDPKIGGSNFFKYRNVILRLVKQNPNVTFIIRPHPLMFNNFIDTGEMTEKEVGEFRRFCYDTKNIILDESKDYTKTFWESDFLIADPSGIVAEYYVTNHPIIYCHAEIDFDYMDYAHQMFAYSYEINNEDELIHTFNLLCNNMDLKKEERLNNIKDLFGDVELLSDNILHSMKSMINIRER